eukprot:Gb_14354 [translate_table: standard]
MALLFKRRQLALDNGTNKLLLPLRKLKKDYSMEPPSVRPHKALADGKWLHAIMIETGFKRDVFSETKLVIMYAKCGSLFYGRRVLDKTFVRNVESMNAMITGYAREGRIEDARQVFDQIPERSVVSWNAIISAYIQNGRIEEARQLFEIMPEQDYVSWNAMISGYAQNRHGEEALKLFSKMQQVDMEPNGFTFTSILSACCSLAALDRGKQVHAYIIKKRFDSDVFVGSALVNLYGKCGNLEDLDQVFNKMPKKNAVAWNAAISAYAQNGRVEYARHLFDKMTERNVVSWTAMLTGYVQIGKIEDARKIFDAMPLHNVVSWTAMIAGYVQNENGVEAMELFREMQKYGMKPNLSTLSSVVNACASLAAPEHGMQVHALIVKMGFEYDAFLESALVDMYVKCTNIDNARLSFDKMSKRDVVSWNVMITGYAQNGRIDDARELLEKMPEPDVISWNAMIDVYCQNGRIEDAQKLFIGMPERNVVSWTTMLTGYAQNGRIEEARQLFDRMPRQDVIAWTAMISGYIHNRRIEDACCLFDKMPERNVVSWNVMIAGYIQHGKTQEARLLFDNMPECSVISWSAMTAAYARDGHSMEAIKLYSLMRQTCTKPNQSIFTSVLNACAQLAVMEQSKQFHVHIIKYGFELDVFVANTLISTYAKCGNISDGCQIFEKMPQRDAISWNAMISGYALHGFGKEGIHLFEKMQQSGVLPDHITFISVLSACSHGGLVDEGWHYFDFMSRVYCISPRADHYACMVDLLGRAGCLDEAKELINNMPIEPDAVVWSALLGACRIHGHVQLGKHAAEQLLLLEPENAAPYVMLSNIYGGAGRWDDAAKLRIMMKDKGIEKNPGCSWIEVKSRVHTFLVGDMSHPQT